MSLVDNISAFASRVALEIKTLSDTVSNKVDTTDSRLSDARTPTAHDHLVAQITDIDSLLDDAQVVYRWDEASQTWPTRGTEPFGSLWLSTNDETAPAPTHGAGGPIAGDLLAKLVVA